MAYTRSRGYRRYAPTVGRIAKPNKRAGECRTCHEEIPPYGGQLYREADDTWSVVHWPQNKPGPANMWDRAPIHGGCPDTTDRENARMLAARFIDGPVVPERERIARMSADGLAANPPRERTAPRAYTASGARMSYRCTHEDYPCCGC